WCVGWARRGPSGTIGTNRQDGFKLVERIATSPVTDRRAGPPALDALLQHKGVRALSFDAWKRIDAAEVARARAGAPREKFVSLAELRAAAGDAAGA
ncbi:MAG: pyridine nucleotide-disulfide oxidoreductase, partial [Thermaurantiacus sp.]